MLNIKANTEESVSGSKDLVFLEWVIYGLNIALFAVPILYSLIQDAYSYLGETLDGRKYSAEQVAVDQQVSNPLMSATSCKRCMHLLSQHVTLIIIQWQCAVT